MQVSVLALGTGVFHELLQRGGISDACIGRDGVAPRFRYRKGLEMRKMGHISGGGTPLHGSGGAQEFRESV